VLLKPTNIIEV